MKSKVWKCLHVIVNRYLYSFFSFFLKDNQSLLNLHSHTSTNKWVIEKIKGSMSFSVLHHEQIDRGSFNSRHKLSHPSNCSVSCLDSVNIKLLLWYSLSRFLSFFLLFLFVLNLFRINTFEKLVKRTYVLREKFCTCHGTSDRWNVLLTH